MRRRRSETHTDSVRPLDQSHCTVCEVGDSDEECEGQREAEEEGEEGQVPRMIKSPETPSAEEVANRILNHFPYRSWCPHCVRGRGLSRPHGTQGAKTMDRGATVCLDYGFLKEEDRKGSSKPAPMPAMAASKYAALRCINVPAKGIQHG